PPFGLVYRAAIDEDSLDGVESRCIVYDLARNTRPLTLEPLPSYRKAGLAKDISVLLGALVRCRRSRSVITVTHASSVIPPPDRFACHNVLRVSPCIEVPGELAPHICDYDELWVPSESQCIKLRRAGAAPERMQVVPVFELETDASDVDPAIGIERL